jgi:DNA-binding phage protein
MKKFKLDTLLNWAKRFETKSAAISFLDVKTGIGYRSLQRTLQGKREPKWSEILAISLATGLSVDDLFIDSEPKKEIA